MTSSVTNHDVEDVKESNTISTIHRIYRENDDEIILRDPVNRRSFINRSAYAKLHRSYSSGNQRRSVDNLKGRFEDLARQNSETDKKNEEEDLIKPEEFSPATFGYPKDAKLKPPILKPKPVLRKKKDENSNVVGKRQSTISDAEEINIVLQPSASEESVDKIAKELSNFEMDGKLNRKRTGSIRKFFNLFGKDKKKKEDEKKQINDNIRNESNFNRQAPQRQTMPSKIFPQQEQHEEKIRELEEEYARLHVNRFNQIRESFDGETNKPYISTPINKYIDTSSSTTSTTESEKRNMIRDTPPRAQETNQTIRVVKPRASLPINSERPLPNPYQIEKTSPQTMERNLDTMDKDYPDKNTTFSNGEIKKPPPSPVKLESSKLKLPPNREIYEPQPRVRSPIPTNRISTEKIIATELLKNTRSPTPPKRVLESKPPMSPKIDKIITNAVVHAPRRIQTPLEDRTYINVLPNPRASTPIDLRMSVSMRMSPKKEEIRKSVEEYYWKELKKLKDEEDKKLYSLQMNGYYDDPARLKRSRSLSPRRAGSRSLSLPRQGEVGVRGNYLIPPQQPIPEDQPIMSNNPQYIYNQNFMRNNVERRSVDSLQRPIFRRGSLTKQEIYEPTYNKRVSFQNQQQAWPTRNGYTQTPPQRVDYPQLDDEVFLPSNEPIYNRIPSEPLYSNRMMSSNHRLSMDSLYVQRRRPPVDAYVPLQRYSSRQSIPDRHHTVNQKYCDIYGQIHELPPPPQGVVMGQLRPQPDNNFIRGSRLTASANDIGHRFDYENRPLPPPPRKPQRNTQISDTESGSDASEIQRIMHNKTKNKKRGFFGK